MADTTVTPELSPGPWRTIQGWIQCGQGHEIAYVYGCECVPLRTANLHVMAAAPQMLEVLRRAWAHAPGVQNCGCGVCIEIADAIAAAIAAATGEQP